MLSKTTFTVILLALAKYILADSPTFSLLSLHSYSNLHQLTLKEVDGKLEFAPVSDTETLTASITENGALKIADGKYVMVDSNGVFQTSSQYDASKGFSIVDNYLSFEGSDSFYAVPIDGSSYNVSIKSTSGAVDINVFPKRTDNGQAIPDFTPSGESSSSTNLTTPATLNSAVSTITSATATSTSVSLVVSNSTKSSGFSSILYSNSNSTTSLTSPTAISSSSILNLTSVSQNSSPQTQTDTTTMSQKTANGADKLHMSMASGVIAAIAALLL